MYFSRITMAILTVASTPIIYAAPQIVSNAVSIHDEPTLITGDKQGAVTYLNSYTSTVVVYQAPDTSIHSLIGTGPPTSTYSYTDTLAILTNTPYAARNDTPLALAAGAVGSDNGVPHVYYLSASICTINGQSGNYVYEASQTATSGWQPGLLNNLQVCSSNSSNLLYALGPVSGASTSSMGYETFRVGYVSASNNQLCEAVFNAIIGGQWTTTCF